MTGTVPVVTAVTVTPHTRAAQTSLRGGLTHLRRMLTVELSSSAVDGSSQDAVRETQPGSAEVSHGGNGANGPQESTSETPLEGGGTAEVRALVARAQNGDREAFGQIYDRYQEMVYRYIYFRVGNRQLAEDLQSEAFVRALRRIATFTWQGRDFGAWLVTIARNLVADHFKSGRHRLEMATAEVLDVERTAHTPEGAPEATVCDKLTNATLLRAVAELNPDQRECIVLRFLQGFTVAETARAMKKNEGAIKALQYRAVRALARLLPEGFSR